MKKNLFSSWLWEISHNQILDRPEGRNQRFLKIASCVVTAIIFMGILMNCAPALVIPLVVAMLASGNPFILSAFVTFGIYLCCFPRRRFFRWRLCGNCSGPTGEWIFHLAEPMEGVLCDDCNISQARRLREITHRDALLLKRS